MNVTEKTLQIGIIGAGDILGQYLKTFDAVSSVHVAAIAAAHIERAQAAVVGRDSQACTVDALLVDPAIDVVVNLTPPPTHAQLNGAAVAAGKHIYSEKPLAATPAEAGALLIAASKAGVSVGCAPDTFLGTGLQTTARALADGMIGEPFAAMAIWGGSGPEPWHPNPQFFYEAGGGPVLDMGPYYVTALVAHLGPVAAVHACSRTTNRARVVGSGPLKGTALHVDVPTYATAILEHVSGVLSTVSLSFETFAGLAGLEIYGTGGTLRMPDPNMFDLRGAAALADNPSQWAELEPSGGYTGLGRGVGAIELWASVQAGRTPRASGSMAAHVTDVLAAINAGGDTSIDSRFAMPALVPLGDDPTDAAA